MLHLSSSGAAERLSGDNTENENDELNGEDIDTTWRLDFPGKFYISTLLPKLQYLSTVWTRN